MKTPKLNWIPFNPDRPPIDLTDCEDAYLVLIEDKGYPPQYPNEPCEYYMDVATAYGSYLDNFWDTTNDWNEGNDIHVIAYCGLGDQVKVEEVNI